MTLLPQLEWKHKLLLMTFVEPIHLTVCIKIKSNFTSGLRITFKDTEMVLMPYELIVSSRTRLGWPSLLMTLSVTQPTFHVKVARFESGLLISQIVTRTKWHKNPDFQISSGI